MPGTRRSSLVGAVLLVALGLFFLYSQLSAGPGSLAAVVPLLARPADFFGCGKSLGPPQAAGCLAIRWRLAQRRRDCRYSAPDHRRNCAELPDACATNSHVETIDRRGSEPVQVHIQMPAGELKLSGGASKLMEADFNYDEAEGKPRDLLPRIGRHRSARHHAAREKVPHGPSPQRLGPALSE